MKPYVYLGQRHIVSLDRVPTGHTLTLVSEKNLRVQIPHRISVTRAGIRLPEIARDRREDQQDQVVSTTKCLPLPPFYERQDDKVVESVREVLESGGGKQSLT